MLEQIKYVGILLEVIDGVLDKDVKDTSHQVQGLGSFCFNGNS